MAFRDNRLWRALESWSATAFLLGGGLLLLGTIIAVAGAILSTPTQAVTAMSGFAGVVLSFVAVLGLYPRLADRSPQVAKVGLLLVVFPLIFTVVLLIWHSPELIGIDVPSLNTYLPSPGLIYGVSFVLTAIGITIFGVLSLQTDAFVPAVGGLLFVVAAAWFFLIGAAAVYGFPLQDWVANVHGAIMGVGMVALGYQLRTTAAPPDSPEPASDTAV